MRRVSFNNRVQTITIPAVPGADRKVGKRKDVSMHAMDAKGTSQTQITEWRKHNLWRRRMLLPRNKSLKLSNLAPTKHSSTTKLYDPAKTAPDVMSPMADSRHCELEASPNTALGRIRNTIEDSDAALSVQ